MTHEPGIDPHVTLHDDASVQEAVRQRQQRRDIARFESDIATFTGTLRDLAERRVGVTLQTDDDHGVRGILLAVAVDHIVVAMPSGQHAMLPLDAVHYVRTDPDVIAGVARSDRSAAQDLLLTERLARWQRDQPFLAVYVKGRSDPLRGHLVAVGEDVVTLRSDSDHHPTWIATDAIRCVVADPRRTTA